jgi:hypothetical protein
MKAKGLPKIQMCAVHKGPRQPTSRTTHAKKGIKGAATRKRLAKKIDLMGICRQNKTRHNNATGDKQNQ